MAAVRMAARSAAWRAVRDDGWDEPNDVSRAFGNNEAVEKRVREFWSVYPGCAGETLEDRKREVSPAGKAKTAKHRKVIAAGGWSKAGASAEITGLAGRERRSDRVRTLSASWAKWVESVDQRLPVTHRMAPYK
jgi:hypothetical protein